MNCKKRNRVHRERNASSKKIKNQLREESDLSSVEDNEDANHEVQIDLSGFELAPCDFTGIRLLLSRLLLKTQVDLSEMSSFLIDGQLEIGSVIKESEIDDNSQTDDEENPDDTVYALISVLNMSSNTEYKFVNQLRNHFLELSKQYATEKTKEFIDSLLNNSAYSVGFILNERYLNLPPAVSVPSFSKLKNEIETLSKKDAKYNFTHYIMICKLYKILYSKKKKSSDQTYDTVWCNAEEEIIDMAADSRFEYSVTNCCDSGVSGSWTEDDAQMLPFRRVLIFSSHKFDDIIKKITTFTQ